MGSATPRRRSTFAGLTLELDDDQVIPLMCALAATPYTLVTRRLLETLEMSLPGDKVAEYKAAAVKHIEMVDRLYTEAVERKIGNKIREAARAKAVPQIIGRQTGDNGLRYVRAIRSDGGFLYTSERSNALVLPSRNQAHRAVRRRMESALRWAPGSSDAVGKYTDFFTEPHEDRIDRKGWGVKALPVDSPLVPKPSEKPAYRPEWGMDTKSYRPGCTCDECVKRRNEGRA